MYLLPNNKKIKDDGILEAMEDSDLTNHYFLDAKTGEVEIIPEMFDEEADERLEKIEEQSDRYFCIPQIPSYEQYKWMEEFVQDFVGREDKNLQEKLEIALDGKGAFSRFKNVLLVAGGGWFDAWEEWKRNYLYEELEVWLAGLPIDIKEDSEYFDDCPVCQAMKEGKTSFKQLKEVFQKAKEQGAVVGGEWFKDGNKEDGEKDKLRCGLCGNAQKKLIKTDCCGNWICDDEDEYVLFSYARNSCARNHRRFTLCGFHNTEEHMGDWKTCKKCFTAFEHELEMYVWYGTNEYNFEKLPNPPAYEPRHCQKCGKVIVLSEGGYSVLCGVYRCDDCPITDSERENIIRTHKKQSK